MKNWFNRLRRFKWLMWATMALWPAYLFLQVLEQTPEDQIPWNFIYYGFGIHFVVACLCFSKPKEEHDDH